MIWNYSSFESLIFGTIQNCIHIKANQNYRPGLLPVHAFLVFLLVFFFSISSHAQISKIDSLKNVLSSLKADTNKINALNELGTLLFSANPDSAISLANQAVVIANAIGWIKGKAKANSIMGLAYHEKGDFSIALNNHFIALAIDEDIMDKTGIAKHLGNIGSIYMDQKEYQKSLEYTFRALKISEEIGNNNYNVAWMVNIGSLYWLQGDNLNALHYYTRALKKAEAIKKGFQSGQTETLNSDKLDAQRKISAILGNIGNIYVHQGDYPKALDNYLKALSAKEELGDNKGISNNLMNIGGIYLKQGDFAKARDNFFKAMKIAGDLENKSISRRPIIRFGWSSTWIQSSSGSSPKIREVKELFSQ